MTGETMARQEMGRYRPASRLASVIHAAVTALGLVAVWEVIGAMWSARWGAEVTAVNNLVQLTRWAGYGVIALVAGLTYFTSVQRNRYIRSIQEKTERLEKELENRTAAETALLAMQNRFQDMLGMVQFYALILDLDGRVEYANDYLLRITGWSREETLGETWFERFLPPEECARLEPFYRQQILSGDLPATFEHTIQTRAGEARLVWWNNVLFRDAAGAVTGAACLGVDVTEQLRIKNALQRSEELFRHLSETTSAGIFISQNQKFVYINPAAEQVTGYSCEALMQQNLWDIVHPDYRDLVRERNAARSRGEPAAPRYEIKIIRKDGSESWLDLTAGLTEFEGKPAILGTVIDINERKAFEAQLLQKALYDELTGLSNRGLLLDRIARAIASSKRYSARRSALLFLDLDRFNMINDGLGHASGDRLLAGVARRLEDSVRTCDTVARVGGDEYAILIEEITAEGEALHIARRIQEALAQPFAIQDKEIFTSTSIGVAFISDPTQSPEDLLRDADTAMMHAKSTGKGQIAVFQNTMHTKTMATLELEADLQRAYDRSEFEVFYQPILPVTPGLAPAFEALIRWHHPTRGLLPPGEFIPVAEESGLIARIGEWVLRTACQQLKSWRASGQQNLRVSVNLSACQFQDHSLPGIVQSALEACDLPPDSLELEITERAAMRDVEHTIQTLRELKRIGLRISLDDFGNGYSSLGYLRQFPANVLKIDRSFVHDLHHHEDSIILSSVISMAHALNLEVVAEGVETESQRQFLVANGCDFLQGYLLGRPSPAQYVAFEMCDRQIET